MRRCTGWGDHAANASAGRRSSSTLPVIRKICLVSDEDTTDPTSKPCLRMRAVTSASALSLNSVSFKEADAFLATEAWAALASWAEGTGTLTGPKAGYSG